MLGPLLSKLRRLCSRDGALFLKSAVLLALTRVGLTLASLRYCRQIVARFSAGATHRRSAGRVSIDRIAWAVFKASLIVPGARHCLTQALTAQFLLAREGQPTQLRLGVAKDELGYLKAHAWLESDGIAIFGVPDSGLGEYQRLPYLDRS
jgi:hypothetical protein